MTMSYDEALARIMLVVPAPGMYGSGHEQIERRARVPGPIIGKLRALRSRGWVRYKPSSGYWGGGAWTLTPEGVQVQEILRIVRDRTVESPAWP